MGIYDREYYREERSGLGLRAPTQMVGVLIGINVAVFLLDFLLLPSDPRAAAMHGSFLRHWLALSSDTLTRPWLWWQFVTYGFAHASQPMHILGNMLGLWVFGNPLEDRFGRWEFLRFYLICLAFGGVAWAVLNQLQGNPPTSVYGASGAVAGLIVLYAQIYPRQTILLFFVIPIPAWLLGVLFVASDMLGATGGTGESNIAYTVHLAGAAFALLYHQLGWNFSRLNFVDWSRLRWPGRPRLRVLRPESDEPEEDPGVDEDEVDRILAKITRSGEASLTSRERRTLQQASRELQRRRRGVQGDE